MQKKIFIIFSAVSTLFISCASLQASKGQGLTDKDRVWQYAQASSVEARWRKKADTNGDGQIDKRELAAWEKLKKESIDENKDGIIDGKERRRYWRHSRSRVNTDQEKKYDLNSNGWLESNEAKKLLQDRHAAVKSTGKAKVETEIEADYDSDGNGIIDSNEAKDLKGDLGI